MHPLFFIGVALAVAGVVASSNKKTPANNPQQEDGVESDDSTKMLQEPRDAADLDDEDALDGNEQEQKLLALIPANSAGFDGDYRKDLRQLFAKDPHAILDPAADIATKASRFFKEQGDDEKSERWRKRASNLRDYPNKGKNDNAAD